MERITFDKMNKNAAYHYIMNLHLQAYVFAHRYVFKKKILDAACGTCFGSMIFSTAAKSIIAIDKNTEAIEYGTKKLPFFCPMRFITADLEKTVLPKADICVSLETIEHLKDTFFLENLKVKTLLYSVPINMPVDKDSFHKQFFPTPEAAVKHIKAGGWTTTLSMVGDNGMMLGIAERL